MPLPGQGKRRRREKDKTPALSRGDKVTATAVFAGMFALLIVGAVLASRQQNARALEALIELWRVKYQLNDEQVARIRRIELEFHGSGNIFTRPGHTLQETREHYRAIANVMAPEVAKRFMAASATGESH